MFNSGQGEYTYTFQYERNSSCPSCSKTPVVLKDVDGTQTVKDFLEGAVASHPSLSFKAVASIRSAEGKCIYWPRYAAEKTAENLHKPLRDLVPDGSSVSIVDTRTMVSNAPGIVVELHYIPTEH
jgi:hypothetical protein